MRDIILTAFIFGLIPFVLIRPYIGLMSWAWLSYMNPHRLTWGFAYTLPFVQVTAIATLLGLIFTKDRQALPITFTTIVWIIFVLWMCVTTLFAIYPDAAADELDRTIKIQLMILATLVLVNTPKKLNYLVWVIVLSIGFYGFKGGIFTILTAGKYTVWGPPDSFIAGNNEIAFAMLITLPLMWYLAQVSKIIYVKYFVWCMLFLTSVSILGSYSRGAVLGTAAMLIALWLKSSKKMLALIPIIIVLILAYNFMPTEWKDRVQTIQTYEEDRSAMGRINAWYFAINLTKDKPVMGGGYGVYNPDIFRLYAPDPLNFKDSHSIYFEVLAEHGYVGLFLFLLLGLMVMVTAQRVIYKTKKNSELKWLSDLCAMVQVCFIGYAVGGSFIGLAYFDLPYHFMAISVIASRFADQLNEEKSLDSDKSNKTEDNLQKQNGYSKYGNYLKTNSVDKKNYLNS